MIERLRVTINRFIHDEKPYPITSGIAAGLYPILFYYSNNFTLVNTWVQLGYFIVTFLLFPIIVFYLANKLSSIKRLSKWNHLILPFLNIFVFLFLLKVCLYGDFQKKLSLGILIFSAFYAYFFYKHSKKIVILQFVLALIGVFTLLLSLKRHFSYSKEWLQQNDDIEKVLFKSKPNVYYIQADGYVNASEIKRGYYNFDNSDFDNFLIQNHFTYYENFRSNYAFTLASNSSSLMMKHHYYNGSKNYKEVLNSRDIIISKNSVLDIFKNNGYKTYFLSEMSYFLLNRPKMGFDVCNLSYDDVSFIGRGLEENINIIKPFKKYLKDDPKKPKFFFIQILAPSHITGRKIDSKGIGGEREKWLVKLKRANKTLQEVINNIKIVDPQSLIVLTADHGGFVGMNHTLEANTKSSDRDKIYSIFSCTLAIHWPNNIITDNKEHLKTTVNLFRVLFSYLSGNERYLLNKQEDASYIIINKCVYKYIDEDGNVVFDKLP